MKIPLPRFRRVAVDALDLALACCGLLRCRNAPAVYESAMDYGDLTHDLGEARRDLLRQKRRAEAAEDEVRRLSERGRGAS